MEEKLTRSLAPYKYVQERTDAELVKLAREDDRHAFNLLMERYQVMASCIAIRMVPNEENAHDLLQEAMLQAFLSLNHIRDEERFKNWFYGIVLNVCRNWRREVKADTISLNTPRGKYIRLVSNIKTVAVENQASLYIQLDGVKTDKVQEKSLQGTNDWSEQDVIMFVPEQGIAIIRFGLILHGKGQVWLDNVRFEIVEPSL